MNVIQENSTHKAIQDIGCISVYLKGCSKENFDQEFIDKFPEIFRDEFICTVEHEDDLLPLFERFEENNRINLNEAQKEFQN